MTVNGTSPLAYQWLFNGHNILNATTNPFTLNNVPVLECRGNYSVVVTNFYGSVTSAVAVLAITNLPPMIVTNPVAQSVFVGGNATFNVSAAGTVPLHYQWRFNGTNIINATNAAYLLSNVQLNNAGNYAVIVTNFVGSVTSAPAILTIKWCRHRHRNYPGRLGCQRPKQLRQLTNVADYQRAQFDDCRINQRQRRLAQAALPQATHGAERLLIPQMQMPPLRPINMPLFQSRRVRATTFPLPPSVNSIIAAPAPALPVAFCNFKSVRVDLPTFPIFLIR
ncbi:MAG: immunoglobulin domain-containing protein [Limisphaerales bacterium]